MIDFFSSIVIFLLNIINEIGYIGIFVGMTIESSFFPFPSEIILIPAGALVASGEMNFFLVFISALLGSLAGAIFNFFLALYLGRTAIDFILSKYGKFFFISKKQVRKSDDYFKKYGEITTFVGRLIPGVRQLISIPAGFSKMNFPKFILFTSLGAGIWSLFLISTGYFFGENYLLINENMGIVNLLFLLLPLLIIIIYILWRKRP